MECLVNPLDNTITLRKLFYSFGYTPEVDKVLKIDFGSLIKRNPMSVDP
jgi:hypothetical protein